MRLRSVVGLGTCAAALTVVMLAAAACSQDRPSLSGTSWKLTGWAESSAIPAQVTITARFSESTVSGDSGVNSYSGAYTAGGDGAFRAGPIAGTMMAGPQPAMDAEAAYLRRLEAAKAYAVSGDTLVLNDADGNDSLTFTRSD